MNAPRPRRTFWLDLGALVYFVAITMWLTWPLTARLTTALSGSPDSLLNFWALGWNYHVLPTAPPSYFDANIFAPRPDTLAYSEHLFAVALVGWPFYALSGNLVLAYNAAMGLSFVLSGLGMYLLTRDLTGGRWAALAAGTVFLAAPYRLLHLLHLQLLTLQWFPFVFWCLFRFFSGRPCPLARRRGGFFTRRAVRSSSPRGEPQIRGVSEAMSAIRVLRTRRENTVQQRDATLPGRRPWIQVLGKDGH